MSPDKVKINARSEVREMIESLYKFADIPINWEIRVNEQVAEVFGKMLDETMKCSKAIGWVPKPPGGRASIAWLVMQLGSGAFNHYRSRMSFVCARSVIYKWGRHLQMASMGLSPGGGLK